MNCFFIEFETIWMKNNQFIRLQNYTNFTERQCASQIFWNTIYIYIISLTFFSLAFFPKQAWVLLLVINALCFLICFFLEMNSAREFPLCQNVQKSVQVLKHFSGFSFAGISLSQNVINNRILKNFKNSITFSFSIKI